MLTNIAQMVHWKSKTRGGNRWNKRGPLLLTLASVPLVMLDLTRHVLQDGGAWIEGSRMYRPGCGHADVRCLSGIGATCLLATYVGFACLISGVLWSADVPRKLRDGGGGERPGATSTKTSTGTARPTTRRERFASTRASAPSGRDGRPAGHATTKRNPPRESESRLVKPPRRA